MHVKTETVTKACWCSAIVIFFFFVFWFYPFTIDDAYISFRYAENFVQGHGLTWNPGDDPVEGYSNFLWVLVSAFILKLGLPIEGGIKFVGIVLQLINLKLVYEIAQFLTKDKLWSSFTVLLTAITPAFGFWAVGGLENPLFMFFFFLSILLFLKELEHNSVPYSSIVFALSAMTRHEGAILFVVSLLYRGAWCFSIQDEKLRVSKDAIKNTIWAAMIFGVLYTPYFLWRWQYYGYIFPNTYYAKIARGAGWPEIVSFIKYFWPFLLMALPSLFSMKGDDVAFRKSKGAVYLWLLILVSTMLLINRNPIMGNYYRFFLHFMPLVYILCIPFWMSVIQKKVVWWHVLALGVILLIPLETTNLSSNHETYTTYAKGLHDAHIKLGEWINQATPKNVTIAITDAGAVPFYAKRRTIDLWGLNNEHIAHEKFSAEYFWSEDPDVVILFSVTPDKFVTNYESEQAIFYDPYFQQEFEPIRVDSWKRSSYNLITFARKSLKLSRE